MIFRPDLAELVVAGRKTVTRRVSSGDPRSPWWRECGLVPGRCYAVRPGRGASPIGRVRVVSVRLVRLGRLDEAEARREGFASAAEFEAAWESIYGVYDPDALVWRVEFESVPNGPEAKGEAGGA